MTKLPGGKSCATVPCFPFIRDRTWHIDAGQLGTILAYDDWTPDELWRINVGSGFNAPPMTYAANGKQYIAIASGLC